MEFKWTTNLNHAVYTDAIAIRQQVFIEEQNVPLDLEIDEYESNCYHVVGYHNNSPICTARLLAKTPTDIKLQRVAVLKEHRQKGIGRLLVEETMKKAQQENFKTIVLGAQLHAIPFYESLGFNTLNDKTYLDAGILHKDMYITLNNEKPIE